MIPSDFLLHPITIAKKQYEALRLFFVEKISDQSIYEKFLLNSADIILDNDITVKLKKKRNLPLLLETMNNYQDTSYKWLGNKKIIFEGATYS